MWYEVLIEIEVTAYGIRSNQESIFGIGSGEKMADKRSGVSGGEKIDKKTLSPQPRR